MITNLEKEEEEEGEKRCKRAYILWKNIFLFFFQQTLKFLVFKLLQSDLMNTKKIYGYLCLKMAA